MLDENFDESSSATQRRNLDSNEYGSNCDEKWKANIIVNAKKVPGFLGFTGFKIGAFHPDILIPMPEYAKLYRYTRYDTDSIGKLIL